MNKVSCVVVLLVCAVACLAGSVHSWGWHFGHDHGQGRGGGHYGYNHDHHHHRNDYGHHHSYDAQERIGSVQPAAAVETFLDEGDSVGRFRRQNSTLMVEDGPGEGRLNNNLNTCRVESNRVLGRWRCNSGEIIDCNGLCNGRRDCADGSDETVISCRHVFCLDSAFRCAYGGCIRAEMECNGVQDCADGSDEKTVNCPGVLNKIRAKGSCNDGFFQCKSGECIFDDGVCSGGAECADGSEETAAVCSTHFCPEPGFRCDYGACVPRMARCDGKRDCIDGSDEKPELCNNLTAIGQSINRLPTQIPSEVMTALLSSTSPGDTAAILSQLRELLLQQESHISTLRQDNLQLRLNLLDSLRGQLPRLQGPGQSPSRPVGGVILDPVITTRQPIIRDNLPVTPPTLRQPEASRPQLKLPVSTAPPPAQSPPPISTGPREDGDCDAPLLQGGRVSDVFGRRYDERFVKNGQEIVFECLAGTSLIGVNSTYCINGRLLQDLPLCTNQCSGLPLNTLSVQAECFEPTGVKIPCSPLLPPKTIAVLTCKIGYKRPDRIVPDAYTCMDDGNWNAHVYKCIPICGEVTEGRQLIVGGTESNITQVPWHAGIYENIDNRMEQICGGSIINPTAIVTAAHCFWDQQRKAMKDAALYGVAVGKTLRDFEADEPTSQRYKVASIKIYDQYMDYEGLFVSDIAVVLLDKPIIFQSYIKPICVELSLKGNQRYVVSGITGRVAGWGLTASAGEPSAVLKTIDLPTVDFNTCLNESPASFKPFITTDKFCGGFTSGESVCRGDSGGGLAFPKPSEDMSTTVYFLRGIVSVGPILQGSCDNTKYSAFTDIQLHNLFLYDYLFV